jgi:hypothetical protein
MKKIITLFTLFVLFTGLTNSQNTPFRFGIKIDPQLSWYNIIADISEPAEQRVHINIGLMADKYFAENYAVSFGASLNNTGGSILYKNETSWDLNDKVTMPADEEIEFRIQYLQLPLGLKFMSKSIGYVRIFADLGADGFIRLRALGDIPGEKISNNDANGEIRLFNLGYHIGGGIEYSLGGNTSLMTGITYTNALIDAVPDEDDNVNINMLALRIGIMF